MASNTTAMHDASQHLDTSTDTTFRIVVAAGGTGGHIFPAVAVVEQLRALTNEHCSALFLGSLNRMETTLIPKLGYPFVGMPIEGFRGLLSLSTLTLPFKILQSATIARNAIRSVKPHAVVCTGAYISYPAGIAALREGIPLFVLESNFNPGKTNARLAKRATKVVLSFEESRKFYGPEFDGRLAVLGNPVRSQIHARITPQEARRKWRLDPNRPTLLVFGGSLGARSLNNAMQAALQPLASTPYQVLWQTGGSFTAPSALPSNVVATQFIEDMGEAYAAADLVVCRSGATTIAELGIAGKPAVLVPLPSASTNEQRHNATVVRDAGGCVVVDDADVSTRLKTVADELLADRERLHAMAAAMQTLGRPNAAADTARLILNHCSWPTGEHS